ncbi:V-type ATP synthase subunit E [Mobilitalea sibirica]|uniref:V-type ATP synthase subunit E n=1 Tax=Mobilitalea sibirica TaxID=1462919 RepID=A0A8J7H4G7_9FIRM|nr:V-type ATP synthase subunit E [Mobilitalea sibirica]MBH1942343.1 V-type ATP synthase subunit E [Mobilitalea sibirica]
MDPNEKLDNFYTAVIDSATAQSIEIIEDYKKTLQKIYNERKQAAQKKAQNTYQIETDNIIREKNRRLSGDILESKRKVLEKTSLLTDKIFKDVRKKLDAYMKSPAYVKYLSNKIAEAYEFARGEEIIIYINPSDEALKSVLEKITGVNLTISNRDFMGGIRAVIPSRTILIDHSFTTKLSEQKETFRLH